MAKEKINKKNVVIYILIWCFATPFLYYLYRVKDFLWLCIFGSVYFFFYIYPIWIWFDNKIENVNFKIYSAGIEEMKKDPKYKEKYCSKHSKEDEEYWKQVKKEEEEDRRRWEEAEEERKREEEEEFRRQEDILAYLYNKERLEEYNNSSRW